MYPESKHKISSDVSGESGELYVEEGDSVKAGQIIARINPDVYLSAVERSSKVEPMLPDLRQVQVGSYVIGEAQKIRSKHTLKMQKGLFRNKNYLVMESFHKQTLEASEAQLKILNPI
ncbi:MAG: biotin/lipoyl-binding protein [Saprospiraceae bacterium]|nr:biotin/lipoyl-binding protein [Candidatus Vicinibacter affinis]